MHNLTSRNSTARRLSSATWQKTQPRHTCAMPYESIQTIQPSIPLALASGRYFTQSANRHTKAYWAHACIHTYAPRQPAVTHTCMHCMYGGRLVGRNACTTVQCTTHEHHKNIWQPAIFVFLLFFFFVHWQRIHAARCHFVYVENVWSDKTYIWMCSMILIGRLIKLAYCRMHVRLRECTLLDDVNQLCAYFQMICFVWVMYTQKRSRYYCL